MTSRELVAKTIKGENTTDVTPVYGWVSANLSDEIAQAYGSVQNFEDHYEFDMAHIFGGPGMYDRALLDEIRQSEGEITPEMLLQVPFRPTDLAEDYEGVKQSLEFYRRERERFCYIQSNGIFELNNGFFGIEDHLCWIALYKEELKELYSRQARWNAEVASNMLELGMDMVHISDDWGAQNSLMFSPEDLRQLIAPNHLPTAKLVKDRGAFLSLHSDGCIRDALDTVVELGYDVVHPWQEAAGMSYDLYLEKYQNSLAILGGLCIQTTLGFGDLPRLESEIRRIFSLLRGKRWICCTTHFVQNHCSMEELTFAYDLVMKLSGKR